MWKNLIPKKATTETQARGWADPPPAFRVDAAAFKLAETRSTRRQLKLDDCRPSASSCGAHDYVDEQQQAVPQHV